jgi:polysaccharide biosynthesis/export protein
MQNSKKIIFPQENCMPCFSKIYRPPFKERAFLNIQVLLKQWGPLCCLIVLLCVSCSPIKYNVYFKNLQKDTVLRNIVTPNYELKIQKNDILGITVVGLSPDVSFFNNSSVAAGASGSSASTAAGYPVDSNGNISFVKLGTIHTAGMTRKELKDTLEKGLIPYLKDVVVTVSFLNRHVTLLGGVNTQVLPMVGDNMTILDALAASGDIGQKGKIDNVLIIRDTGTAKIFKRLNLENNSIFSSPYYYLQPNDIVYVEQTTVKTPITTPQIVAYITSGASLIFLILNALKL